MKIDDNDVLDFVHLKHCPFCKRELFTFKSYCVCGQILKRGQYP